MRISDWSSDVCSSDLILSAAPIDAAAVQALFPDRIKDMRTVRFRPDTGGVETLRERRIGAIRLASGPDDSPDPEAVAAALLEGVRAGGLNLLPWSEEIGRAHV